MFRLRVARLLLLIHQVLLWLAGWIVRRVDSLINKVSLDNARMQLRVDALNRRMQSKSRD